MQEIFCPREDSVLLAIRTGQWSEDLRAHVSTCLQCAEVIHVASWMTSVAERLDKEGPMPDPTLAWLRAQLEEHQHAQDRRLRRAMMQQAVVWLGMSVVLTLSLLWIMPSVANAIVAIRTSSYSFALTSSLVAVGAVLVGYRLMLSRLRGAFAR